MEQPRWALDVVSALMGSTVVGPMKKQQQRPPYLWRKRWVEVSLEAFGATSRVVVKREAGSAMISASVPILRGRDGRSSSFKSCHVGAHVEFHIDAVRLRTTSETPVELVSALAALGWPNNVEAHRILLSRGTAPWRDPLQEEIDRIERNGVRRIETADEPPPAGVAGAFFYAPAHEPTTYEEETEVVDDLIERAVLSQVVTHHSARRMRERNSRRLSEVLSRRLNEHRAVFDDDVAHDDHQEDVRDDPPEQESDLRHFVRQLTRVPEPRSFRRVLKKELEWEVAECPSARIEPTHPEPGTPRSERHKARTVIPEGAQPGSRLTVKVPHRSTPLTITVPRTARPGSRIELTYTVISKDKWPGFPHETPEEAPQWRRDRLRARLASLQLDTHFKIVVDRESFLDSVLSQLKGDIWRQQWHVTFRDEPGLDAGGLLREFWTLMSETLFSPNSGLFRFSATDNQSIQLSPLASHIHGAATARLFRVAGRLLAKALLDGQILAAALTRPLLKHILAQPICFGDLQFADAALYQNLDWLVSSQPGDAELLCQTFVVSEEAFGVVRDVELIPGGASIEVTDDNKIEYAEYRFRHAMMSTFGLEPLLRGFYDVIPLEVLNGRTKVETLDARELDVALFGSAVIDVDDWRKHTIYKRLHRDQRRVKYFWRLVDELTDEQRTRLLQWATGTGRLPAGGFKNLQGSAGAQRPFELYGIDGGDTALPRAHTCFNKIDLPGYSSYDKLKYVFISIISHDTLGFGAE